MGSPRLQVLEVLQQVRPEGLQHIALHILGREQREHPQRYVCCPGDVQRQLSSGISAIAGQHDLWVLPGR